MNVLELALQYEPWIIEQRRYFHQYPELSMQEYQTSQKISEILKDLGIEHFRTGEIGVVARIVGPHPGKTILLRADIDALNIVQRNLVDYKSTIEGRMHACGHDGHISINLGAIRILNALKDQIHGTVLFVFQPGEEVALGAKYMIEYGDWFNEVDSVFGAHVWSTFDVGKINITAGPRMAAADFFEIKVKGKSGHGAHPEQTVDATVVAASIIMNLQTLVSRHFNPKDPLVITVGKIVSGTRFNIISGEAVMEGTVRYFKNDLGYEIERQMRQIIEHTAQAYGAQASLEYKYFASVLVNEATSVQRAQQAVIKLFGNETLDEVASSLGAEDFAEYLKYRPGAFAFIGARNPELGADFPHHNECFNIDESILKNGAALYAQYALDFLNEHQ